MIAANDNNGQGPIIVMAGGTGGHVIPALSVANELRQQGESIIWIGTQAGIEARLVPAQDFPIEWLTVQGLRGKGIKTIALAPLKLIQACWQAWQILKRHKPRAVLGMGGFASGPGGLMAWLMRIPLVIHEQNSIIGMTNKILSRFARVCLFAFPQAAQGIRHASVIGNPVRREILDIETPQQRLAGRDQQTMRVLVLGGSLGARRLNQVLPAALALLAETQRPELRHQCGKAHLQDCRALYREHAVEAEVSDFIEDMQAAYAWADLVICRAGALTVAELSGAGIASILVPFPYAVDDHQYHNARYLAEADAAILVREQDFTAEWLSAQLIHLQQNREQLRQMAEQAHAKAYTDATQRVASAVLQVAIS
ncbi:MAG: undecaprenyldiphospho-muramoylpentapeptide beta-N-acetylglucosaminyltransferase [Gammaproteobacteria bacterium]|nr:undecaprenyldiphospho-muramoylpentapeptide beta-N-acetylglucosaminyltransferase [Gammaproteobacteria bacterium]